MLEYSRIRGGNGLRLRVDSHASLRTLIIETGGMSKALLDDLASFSCPALTHLELWLGDEQYGWDGTVDDLLPLLRRTKYPSLRHLGLRNSEITDDIAVAIAESDILPQLDVLDLSLGTLGDYGAKALLDCAAVSQLDKLDLHHHYMSPEIRDRFLEFGPEVVLFDRLFEEDDEEGVRRYVAIVE